MPYGRKRYSSKRRFRRGKPSLFKKPTVRRNRNRLYGLSKQVARLSRVSAMRSVINRYNYTDQFDCAEPYTVRTLTDPTAYTAVFGPTDTFDARKRWNSLKFSMDWQITCGNEPAIIDYTVFILSLKGTSANTTMQRCGQSLSTMATGVDYETLNGHAFVNPAIYNIHYVKRMSTVMQAQVAGETLLVKNLTDTQKRYYTKVSWKKRIGTGLQPSEFINVSKDSIPDHTKLWFVIFNNNAQDLEFPVCNVNVIWSLSTI